MCFQIHSYMRRQLLNTTRVYKYLQISVDSKGVNKVYESPHHVSNPRVRWKEGQTKRVKPGSRFSKRVGGHRRAKAGFYVYPSRSDALSRSKNGWGDRICVELQVSPKDLLHVGVGDYGLTVATYRKVKVVKFFTK
jgi:hypothetical protein